MDEDPSKLAEDSLDEDGDFVPSAEMYIHDDIDDERTIEEEEILEDGEQDDGELDELMKEGDMPLEELLAMYRYNEIQSLGDQGPLPVSDDQERAGDRVEEKPSQDGISGSDAHVESTQSSPKMLRRSMRLFGSTSGGDRQFANDSESEDDSDYEPEHWKREISIGEGYQAEVPDTILQAEEEPDDAEKGRCLWKPGVLTDKQVRSFLLTIRRERGRKQAAMDSPSATRDDEQALYVLKTNSFDTQKALDLIHTSDAFITEAITPWSEEECRQFELGMKKFGKNFNEIKKLVPTRTVKEIVQFYYIWKKTERRDIFIHQIRPNKRKASQLSQVTDYMDKFLDDDQDAFGGVTLDHLSADVKDYTPLASNQGTPTDSTANSDSEEASEQTIQQTFDSGGHHLEQPIFEAGGPQVEQKA